MSTMVINDIQGTGIYAVPTSAAELATADAGLTALIDSVAFFSYARVLAYIATADGGGASRTLACRVDAWNDNGNETPAAADLATLTTAVISALEGDADITSVASITVECKAEQFDWLWVRDAALGLRPTKASLDYTPQIKYANSTLVYNGAFPGGYTSLDLSAIIGVRRARVWLALEATGGTCTVAIRETGDTEDPAACGEFNLQYVASAEITEAAAISCLTDENGTIEHKGTGTGQLQLQSYAPCTV